MSMRIRESPGRVAGRDGDHSRGPGVEQAWATGVADSDPTDGIAAGKMNLWTYDSQHGSSAGYILASLVIFGQ